jgi:hypothetical protein
MGYLNSAEVTVDAILTKKGRELLARGRSAFVITKFAVADDEIDYGLYNPAHPLGTEYYGNAIENLPIVEASPDETQSMRYKLVTLARSRDQNTIPRIQANPRSIELTYSVNSTPSQVITVTTDEGLNASPFGYTAILYDGAAATLTGAGLTGGSPTVPTFFGDAQSVNASVVTGLSFTLIPRNVSTVTETQLVIVGNQTGATTTIPVIINPATRI